MSRCFFLGLFLTGAMSVHGGYSGLGGEINYKFLQASTFFEAASLQRGLCPVEACCFFRMTLDVLSEVKNDSFLVGWFKRIVIIRDWFYSRKKFRFVLLANDLIIHIFEYHMSSAGRSRLEYEEALGLRKKIEGCFDRKSLKYFAAIFLADSGKGFVF